MGLEGRTIFVVDDLDAARVPGEDAFDRRLSDAELDYLLGSDAGRITIAENIDGRHYMPGCRWSGDIPRRRRPFARAGSG